MTGEPRRTFVRSADRALLRGVARLSRGRLDGLAGAYDVPREHAEDLRGALGGLWLVVTALAALAALAAGAVTGLGRHAAFGLVAAPVVAVPATLALVHGVLEGVYRRDADGRWRMRAVDGDRLFVALATAIAVAAWLVYWVLPGR